MIRIQGLRVLVKQFLSAAADEIVEAVEKMISGYEEEMFQSKREISRQRKMLDALLQPEIRLNRISEEAQLKLSVWEEDFLTEQQEWNSSPRQKNPESLQTERSHKEPLSSSQDRRPEVDTIRDTFTPQCVKNEHEMCKEEEEPLPVTSAEQMPIETDEEVPSPGLSEAENGDGDENWRLSDATQYEDSDKSEASQDGDFDRIEEWRDSGRHCMLTLKTPRTKKMLKSCIICKVCGKSFLAEVSLANHLEIHPKDVCGLCGRHFETEGDFKLHLKTHTNVKAEVCDVCGKCFAKPSSLEIHKRIHTGEKPFNCNECGKSFNQHQNMTRHIRVHTGEKPYSCTSCSKCFSDYTTLKRHVQTHLQDGTFDDGDGNAEVKDSTVQMSKKQLLRTVCKVCGMDFNKMTPLVNHAKTHTEDLCGVCGTRFESEEVLKLHLQTHDNGKVCKICGKCFTGHGSLEVHMRVHTGEKPFKCNECGKAFNCHQNMTRHLRVHTGEKPYSCTTCSKCFSDYTTLKRHIQTHLPVKTEKKRKLFRYKECGKVFNQSQNLKRHLIVHTGEKPYSCITCSKCFNDYSTLKRHMRTHLKENTLAVTTPAVDGGNAEVNKDHTEQVMDIQLQNVCHMCGKDFQSMASLVNHATTHSVDCRTRFESESQSQIMTV